MEQAEKGGVSGGGTPLRHGIGCYATEFWGYLYSLCCSSHWLQKKKKKA